MWGVTTILGFQQFGMPTVLAGIGFAYSGSALYAWRKVSDRRKAGLPAVGRTLHLKLTGAMLLVLFLDGIGYLIAISHVPTSSAGLIAILSDIFVAVALLTLSVGLILPGMIAHSAEQVSNAADRLVRGTLADFTRAMEALAAGDFNGAKAHFDVVPVVVHSRDEVGDMAERFNRLQEEIGRAAVGLEGAREGLSRANCELTDTNERLRLAERKYAEEQLERLRNEHAVVLNSVSEGVHWINLEGYVHYENPAGTRMLGFRASEILGKPAHPTMHHTRADGTPHPQCECSIYATLRDGVVRRVEDDLFWRKDGTSFPVEYTCSPIFDESLQRIGAVVVFTDITERKKVEAELRETNKQLLEVSRQAGMAEVATSVLHNVGNVLNSVNISCSVISDQVRSSHIATLTKVANLLHVHAGDLGAFFAQDPRGLKLPDFLGLLAARLSTERSTVLGELQSLSQNIDHIKEVVAVQQNYANVGGVREMVSMPTLVQDSLRMHAEALTRHLIEVVCDFDTVPPVWMEKHKILQILVNLVYNAKDALCEREPAGRRIDIGIGRNNGSIIVRISDNGIGIAQENLTRIFAHGFTTKKGGHGFGLHGSVLAAQEMGGRLSAHSEGPGTGATFILELPVNQDGGPLGEINL
jgi:PAS domain S-box-containing protein